MQNEIQSFVLHLLKEKLPETYYYHNVAHTVYVQEKVVEIGNHEACTADEIDMLKVAALWHDTGYINTYIRHEEESCILARNHLPQFGYNAAGIDRVCGMIMATRMPQSPRNKLEEVMADADLEYLATPLAVTLAENLFRELQYQNPSLTRAQWLKTQVGFLETHQYFTPYCKAYKEPQKQAYLRSLGSSAQ